MDAKLAKASEQATVEFSQVVSRGCGLDVHKKVIVATIDGEGLRRETREFEATTSSLTELRDWLQEKKVTHVAMESTGVYWKPVYNVLEPSGMTVWIVNAAHIKYVPGHKTDRKDSAWICKLLLAGLLKPSYIPPKEQRNLRDLTRYRVKLIQSIAANKNRTIRILEDANIKLSSVLSDTSGVVAMKLIDKLIDKQAVTMADIEEVYHGKLGASKEALYEACQGFFDGHHAYMLNLIREEISSTQETVKKLDERIREALSPYENAVELIKKVPGISTKSAEDLIAEIGLDMSVFPTEKHLASWAGMCPGNNESAGKKKVDVPLQATSR
jgi:transposase